MAQEIRQAKNDIRLTGVVLEHKLQDGKGDSGRYINGSLVIKAGEFTEVTLKVFVSEKNSKGKVKKAYEVLHKILKGELKTAAEVPEEEAVKVKVWGKDEFTPHFKEEIYKSEGSTEVKTLINMDLGFGNVAVDNKIKAEDYSAEFEIEMYVVEVKEEVDKATEEETGRVLIKGWTPVYGGSAIPLTVVAGVVVDGDEEFDFAEDLRTSIDPGMTVSFWGDIDYKKIVEKTSKGGSLGKAKVETKTVYVHDLVTTGAEIVEGENEYQEDEIKAVLVERSRVIKEKEQDDKPKTKGREGRTGVGARTGSNTRPTSNSRVAGRTKPSTTVSTDSNLDDSDDIPF